jgi:hypothetical protein
MKTIIRNKLYVKGPSSSSGGGGGSVVSVNGSGNIIVDNTDPDNPVISTTARDITVVANYSALPSAATVNDEFYWCSASQGTSWLPGSLGGTYYSAGLYYSNGVSWEYLNVPYNATQAEVNTGTDTDKFVTPATLNNYSGWTKTKVGLSNVDNTTDLNKPISIATQTALDLKVDENTAIVAATKTKITYDAKGLVTAGTDATTADIIDGTDKRYVSDAELVVLGNTSGTNTGDNATNSQYSGLVTNATHTGEVTGSGALTVDKTAISNRTLTTIVSSDVLIFGDVSDTDNLKKGLVSDIVAMASGGSILSASDTFDFGVEEDSVVKTISSALITNANVKSFTIIPTETAATSLDDFKLNSVSFNIENIIDNISFDIRANSANNASGIYTATYKLTY